MEKSRIKTKPLQSNRTYHKRIVKSVLFSFALLGISLGIGMLGYHYLCNFTWIDALLNASMILTGMGPVTSISSVAGKLFASFYALFSGIAFLTIFAVFFSPIFHKFLHRFHLDLEERTEEE